MGKIEDEFDRMTAPLGQVRQRFAVAVERVVDPGVARQLRECFAMVLGQALHPFVVHCREQRVLDGLLEQQRVNHDRFVALGVLAGAVLDDTVEAAVGRLVEERDAAAQAVVTLNEVRRTLHLGEAELSVDGAERVMAELERAERAAEAARDALDERLRMDAEAEAGQRAVQGWACPTCKDTGGVTDPETLCTESCTCAEGRVREERVREELVVSDAGEWQPTRTDRRIVDTLSEVIGVLRARAVADDVAMGEAIEQLRAIREVARR